MNKNELKDQYLKIIKFYNTDKKKYQKYGMIGLILMVLFLIFINYETKEEKLSQQRAFNRLLISERSPRDQVKLDAINLFESRANKEVKVRVSWVVLDTIGYTNEEIDNEKKLKDYFNSITKYDHNKVRYGEYDNCKGYPDIFKIKKVEIEDKIEGYHRDNYKIYVALCLEEYQNHANYGRYDNGFKDRYVEMKIGHWTEDEIVELKNIQDIDFLSEDYENLGGIDILTQTWDDDYLKETNETSLRDEQIEEFISNFQSFADTNIAIWSRKGKRFEFYINSPEELEEYFYQNSGMVGEGIDFKTFISRKENKNCGDNRLVFRYKKISRTDSEYAILICKEDINNIENEEKKYFKKYHDFKTGDWDTDEVIGDLDIEEF